MNPEPNTNSELNFVDTLVKIISIIKQHLLYFIIASVLGIVLGVGFYKLKDKVYASSMTAQTAHLSDSRVIELIDDLNNLIVDRNPEALARKMNLTVAEADKIEMLSATSLWEADKKAIGTENYNLLDLSIYTFTVDAKVKDTAMFDKVEAGLIHYLSSSKYARAQKAFYEKEFKTIVARIDRKIEQEDSIQTLLIKNLQKGNQDVIMGGAANSVNVFFSDLLQKRLEYAIQYKLSKNIEVIRPFTKYKKAVSPRLSISLMIWFSGCNLALAFFLFLKSINKKVKQLQLNQPINA